jgi:shikimate kinase / 3-dehydroquinate synthase
MQILSIKLANHSYPIYIGENAMDNPQYFNQHLKNNQKVLIVTNTTIAPLYLERLKHTIAISGIINSDNLFSIVLNDGEQYKDWSSVERIVQCMLENSFDRHSLIIALGGGVIGDMVGFTCSIYMRGIQFIQVPTSLLAQVDSSIGGKTGINHELGKNMLGAFCHPQAVIADTSVLKTLDKRQLISGIAEILKHAFIADVDFITWLESNIQNVLNLDEQSIKYAVYRSCQIKASFVEQDEKEQNIRAYLNFGHTFGHAIESHMGYGVWLHGEAVGCGMVMAARLSMLQGYINNQQYLRIFNLIQNYGLPVIPPTYKDMNFNDYIKYMSKDKKNQNNQINFIILKSLGNAQKNIATSKEIECSINI